jgi:hypothetical protein
MAQENWKKINPQIQPLFARPSAWQLKTSGTMGKPNRMNTNIYKKFILVYMQSFITFAFQML